MIVDQGELFAAEAERRRLERQPPVERSTEHQFLVGLDLGDVNDYTALVAAEVSGPRGMTEYFVRHIERMPLHAGYPAYVRRTALVTATQPLLRNHRLLVDGTGVGHAVVQMFREAHQRLTAIQIVPGGRMSQERNGDYNVPKRDLVAALQVCMQQRRLRVLKELPEAHILADEAQNFRMKVTEAANETFNAREGKHDDVLLATAMLCWYGETIGIGGGVWTA